MDTNLYFVHPFLFLRMIIGFIIDRIEYILSGRNISALNEENIEGKVVIVTGGSSGMGKASAKEFAKRGAIVLIGDVDLKNGKVTVEEIQKETGNVNVKILKLDLSNMDSVEDFARKVSLEYPKIKIILNNAGIAGMAKRNVITKDGFNIHVAVNYMGHFLLTNLLLNNLKAEENSRVVCMSSTMSLLSRFDMEDLNMQNTGFEFRLLLPYSNTKFCLSLFVKELAKRLEGTSVTAYSLCPALVNTDIHLALPGRVLTGMRWLLWIQSYSSEEAASQFIMQCALDKNIENQNGKMFRYRKPFVQANQRLDDALASRLWEKSSELVHLRERFARMAKVN